MAHWYAAMRAASWRGRMVIAAATLAVVLVAAVPVAALTGLVLMLAGHAVGGLALFGGSVLAAIAGVTIAAKAGVRHLRSLLRAAMDPLAADGAAPGARMPGAPTPDARTSDARTSDARTKDPRVVRLSEGEYRIT